MNANIDLHCDLMAYLALSNTSVQDEVRCSLKNIREGKVKMQVMAMYSSTEKGSVEYVKKQLRCYKNLLQTEGVREFFPENFDIKNDGLSIIAAVENASGFCEEEMPIETMFENFDTLNSEVKLMYIGLTHHTENRFGGGNFTDIGLKEDGKLLLDYIDGKKIAVDLAHTSDQLAFDILNYIDQRNYLIPLIASHSNMRAVFRHNRNLPDELVSEIVKRGGLIGINFVKYFINPEDAEQIYAHIDYALKMGAENSICFGADFFDDRTHPDQTRYPYFFDEYGTPQSYEKINSKIAQIFSPEFQKKMSYGNVLSYFERLANY